MLRQVALGSLVLMSCVHVPPPSSATDGYLLQTPPAESERLLGALFTARQMPIVERAMSGTATNLEYRGEHATVLVNLRPAGDETEVRLFSTYRARTRDGYVFVNRVATEAPDWALAWKGHDEWLIRPAASTEGDDAIRGVLIELTQSGHLATPVTSTPAAVTVQAPKCNAEQQPGWQGASALEKARLYKVCHSTN